MTSGPLIGLVLAGGQGVRLGGRDKAMMVVKNRTLLSRTLDRLAPCQDILVAALDVPEWCSVHPQLEHVADLADCNGEPMGPAGGIAAALALVQDRYGDDAWLCTTPVDAPFAPDDLFAQLEAGRANADVVMATGGGRNQPAFGLWSARCASRVKNAVMVNGVRSLHGLGKSCGCVWSDINAPRGAFLNINTPEDWIAAEQVQADK